MAITFVLVLPLVAGAQVPNSFNGTFPNSVNGSPSPNSVNGNCGNGPCSVPNPLGSTTTVCGLLKKLFEAVVAIGIPVAVLFIIWSGFQFVLAQGSDKQLTKAKRNFYYTIIGIAIFLGAWILAMVIAATVNAIGGSNIISCN